eukprot:COSAG01_NODE_1502_length_10101_cov_6.907119_10_plen_71_part_00
MLFLGNVRELSHTTAAEQQFSAYLAAVCALLEAAKRQLSAAEFGWQLAAFVKLKVTVVRWYTAAVLCRAT